MDILLFKEIFGQEKAIGFLKRIVANDKVASAYLFSGARGIGKTTTALAFALLLNCEKPIDGDGCGECSSCRKLLDGNHPDLLIVEPEQEKKGIGIDQIREINRQLAFSPVLEGYRIIIIDPAEKMTDEAANAFLKTLEEPPPHTVFILNVRDPRELFPTIVSRCQKVPFKPLPDKDIVHWLISREHVDKEKAKIVVKFSEGSLGRALLLAGDEHFNARVDWITMLNRITNEPSDTLLDLAQECSGQLKKTGMSAETRDTGTALMLGIWKSWYRDLLLIKLGGAPDLILNADFIDRLKSASSLYTVSSLMKSLAVIARAEYDLIGNKNLLYVLERSLLGLKDAFQG